MNKKGFSLVELLTTIFIIGIIFSLGGYIVSGVINTSKEKSVAIALENVRKSANSYAKEYYDDIIWQEYKGCISIEELITKGFLKRDKIDELNLEYKYIIVTRDEHKNILSESYDDKNTCSIVNIEKKPLPKNTELCNENLVYDGNGLFLLNKTKIENIYPYYEIADLNRTEINAGTYKINVYLKNGYFWKDNSATTSPKTIECTISKATAKLKLSPTFQKSDKTGETITTLKSNINGNISIKVSNEDYVTATPENYGIFKSISEETYKYQNDITINNPNSRNANTYVTITVTPDIDNIKNFQPTSVIYTIGELPKNGIPIPDESYCTNPTYNGSEQSLINQTILEENAGYAIDIIEPAGGKATTSGEYQIKFKLKNSEDAKENEKFKWDINSSNQKFADTDKIYDELTCEILPLTVKVNYYGNGSTSQKYTSAEDGGIIRYGEKASYDSANKIFKHGIEYDITKDEDGDGTVGANIELIENNFSKTGYSFNGWNTKDDGTGTTYSNKSEIKNLYKTGIFNLYAKWKGNEYKVAYNCNGGTTPPATSTHIYGTASNLNANTCVRSGYTFDEWNTKADGTGTNYSNKASITKLATSGTVTLYAKWNKLDTYKVKYDCNGGNNPAATSSHTYGISSKLTANKCTRTGYTFNGWNTKSDGKGTNYSDQQSVSTLATSGTVTLYAKWKGNTYKVKYDCNGGSNAPSTSTHTYGTASNLTANTCTRTGYTFAGWATKSGGSVAYKNKASISTLATSGTTTLYAKWTAKTYKIEYKGNGSTSGSTSSSTHTYGTSKALTANGFKRTGYSFAGWAKTKGGKVEFSNKESVKNLSTGDTVTLYAKWSDNTKPTCSISKTTSGWKTSGVGVKITCKDSGSGCKTGTRTDTIKKSTTYYVYDNAGNKGSCSVSVSSRKVYSSRYRSYDSCKTRTYTYKGTCTTFDGNGRGTTKYVSGTATGSSSASVTAQNNCKKKCVAGTLTKKCTLYGSSCNAGYSSWSSWSGYTKTSCTASKTVQCQGPQTQYK